MGLSYHFFILPNLYLLLFYTPIGNPSTMYLVIANDSAIYQFTIILFFITAIIFFIAMYWYASSLQNTAREQEKTKTKLKINALELEKTQLRNKILEEAEKARQIKTELLEEAIALKNQELVSSTLLLNNQNQVFENITNLVHKMETDSVNQSTYLKSLKRISNQNRSNGDHWNQFLMQFRDLHPRFFSTIQSAYPNLTQNDLRHCAFIRMHLSTKEIAIILNINPTSVQMNRVRLKKKLKLGAPVDLQHFIQNL